MDNRLHNDCDGGACVACAEDARRAKGWYGAARGAENRERVRAWLSAHLGGTNRECAQALGLSEVAVGRHVRAIRSERSDHKMLDK